MEPVLTTETDLLDVLEELRSREPLFHRPELGITRADFEAMTEESFWETGASGRRYDRSCILDELERRYSAPYDDDWSAYGFHCARIAEDNFLITYTLVQCARVTRRATLWRRSSGAWKAVYHQGTVVAES